VVAPPGTLVNAQKPAAVYQRMVVCHSLVDVIMAALGDAVPEREDVRKGLVSREAAERVYGVTVAAESAS
jgi:N-methylhydantoinase B/oxoprolinase/acetone carboxylase alpha subunit